MDITSDRVKATNPPEEATKRVADPVHCFFRNILSQYFFINSFIHIFIGGKRMGGSRSIALAILSQHKQVMEIR